MTDGSRLIIIGAPRSGTNMLRDVLCRLAGISTWPCDEINAIWRYGHSHWPTDELPPELATEPVRNYIRGQFDRLVRVTGAKIIVEKTCANSLRVPYVDAVLPDAKFVFIHREPLDCIPSAAIRWRAPIDLAYSLRKARYVPGRDLPVYATRFVTNRLSRLWSGTGRVQTWGPVFSGMREALATRSLVEVCAMQWNACVNQSVQAFTRMPEERWISIRYDDFVREPSKGLAALCEFAGASATAAEIAAAVESVTAANIGKGRAALTADEIAALEAILQQGRNALRALNA